MEGNNANNNGLVRDYERNLDPFDADALRAERKARVKNASVPNTPRTAVLENKDTPRVVRSSERRTGK